jgi:hypothetical protein
MLEEIKMVRPNQWFDLSTATSEFKREIKGLLKDIHPPYGHGWSLVKGYMPIKTKKHDMLLTNCLHVVIVPDTTRIRFMKEYPFADPSQFYLLLAKRLATDKCPPTYLSDITVSPPILSASSVEGGLYIKFNGPKEDLLPTYSYSWRKEMPKTHEDYLQNTRLPNIGILGGSITYASPPIEVCYGYFLPYANHDFELLDSNSVKNWLAGNRPYLADVRHVRDPNSALLAHVIDSYSSTNTYPDDIHKHLMSSLQSNTELAIKAGECTFMTVTCSFVPSSGRHAFQI